MTQRIIGPTGSRRRRRFLLVPTFLIMALALMFTAGAQAVHLTGTFELEGDAVDAAGGGDDWGSVFALANGSSADNPCASLGALDCAYTHDPAGATIFTTGGSKDDLNIPSWRHTAGSVPDKDEIEDAMAAMYEVGDDQILYFAADRLAVNGSADFGFWFFRSDVSLNSDGTFSGVHSVGDILLLGTFTQGGADTTVRAFVWDPANATINGTLRDPGVTLTDCSDTAEPDNGCGAVNDAEVDSPWNYQTKSSKVAANKLPAGSFFEGGINLSNFGLEGCFSSFLAETRSSPSIDATLKDFVVGEFESCGATMTTDASSNSFPIGGSVTDSATISVTGVNPPAPTGNVLFYVCGPSVTVISTCNAASGTLLSTEALSGAVVNGNDYTVTSDSYSPTSAGYYCFFATWAGDPNYPGGASVTNFSDECFQVILLTPTIATAQWVYPNDEATLTVGSGGGDDLQGSVKFSLYNNSGCTGSVLYEETRPLPTGAGLTETVATTNGDGAGTGDAADEKVSVDGTYSWLVVFTSTNTAHTNATSVCHDEHFAVDFTNDDPSIP